jgi:hypothetical protein
MGSPPNYVIIVEACRCLQLVYFRSNVQLLAYGGWHPFFYNQSF